MLSSRMNLRSSLVQPWRSVRHTKLPCPELQPAFSIRFRRCQSTAQKPITKTASVNISSASSEQRRRLLEQHGWTSYPRPGACSGKISRILKSFKDKTKPGEVQDADGEIEVTGRISSIRTAGSKLLFVTIYQPPQGSYSNRVDVLPRLQIVVDKSHLKVQDSELPNPVKKFGKLVQRGDFIHVRGQLYRTSAGEESIRATQIPQLLSPCLHQIPSQPLTDDSEHAQDRHVHMLTDPTLLRTIHARSTIVSAIQAFMFRRDFIAVQTPILAASAGGAAARPFETTATEFAGRKLALRIAPELWLKKLLIGGMTRVYEIGQSFRNEGIDKTHNPEFTTCEFYAVNWNIDRLKSETEEMFASIIGLLQSANFQISENMKTFVRPFCPGWEPSWPSIDFIPALNEALELELPDLSSSTARDQILLIFHGKDLPVPSMPTLPRLLDKLSSIYLEPSCEKPTWIINTPECLSPLAKSFQHPTLPNQWVAARAELFVNTKEVVNCYEEENSPHEQRRKFIDQQKHASLGKEVDPEAMEIDEDYLRALEWGLPPTGGWGMGVDRLCMLLLGKDKISDVLPFGNLRTVTHRAEKDDKVPTVAVAADAEVKASRPDEQSISSGEAEDEDDGQLYKNVYYRS